MKFVRKLIPALLLALSVKAHALPIPWVSNQVDYKAQGQDVKDVLRDLTASQGVTARIASGVGGAVSGDFHMPPQRMLETLSSTFGFVWYFDGSILNIVPPDDVQNSLIRLDNASIDDLRDVLSSTGVLDPRFRITFDPRRKTIIVNGPKAYVSLVSRVAERLEAEARHSHGTVIRIYPLHHAWAMDRTANVGGSEIYLAGVAKVLNGMFHPDDSQGKPGGIPRGVARGDISQMTPLDNAAGTPGNTPLPGIGSAAPLLQGLTGTPSSQLQALAGGSSSAPPLPDSNEDLPVIRADQRTNSVLIRDTPDRMFQYGELIRRLDVKPRLIEIEAQIIDIDENALRELGVDWTAHSSHFDFQTGNGANTQNTFNGNLSQNFGTVALPGGGTAAASPSGASLTAVVGDAGRFIMSRISALQSDNEARVEASPKVATLDNIEARMDNNQQFFIRVPGFAATNLFSITTGVQLHVLPMVVQDGNSTQVKLDVVIEDGQLSDQSVDNIPVVTSTNISTSAFVNEGQSLLIAGYKVNESQNGDTGVPFLSDIPLIGALFRTHSTRSRQRDRLFLLTPRIVNL